MTAVGTNVHCHVFHHAQYRDVHLVEHLDALARIQQGQVLGRGDDHRTRHRDLLRQGQLDVTGARRHVDHQVVEIAPVGLGHQLLQGSGGHRATPDHGRVVVGEEGHGHDFDTVGLDRHEPLLVLDLRPGAFGDAEHDALARAIDIGVEDAHPGAFPGQGQGQVGGGGGLAHAALARCHRHHVLDVGQARYLGLGLVRDDHAAGLDLGRAHAFQALDGQLQHLRPAIAEQAGGIAQLQADRDPVALDVDVPHTAGAHRVLVQVGVGVLAKHGFHRCAIEGAHGQLR